MLLQIVMPGQNFENDSESGDVAVRPDLHALTALPGCTCWKNKTVGFILIDASGGGPETETP